MPSRLPPDANGSSEQRRNRHATGLQRQLKEALEAGQLLTVIRLLRRAKSERQGSASPGRHPPGAAGAQRGYRPGGLAPGEVPRRPGGAALTFGIALLAMIAWWLLSSSD